MNRATRRMCRSQWPWMGKRQRNGGTYLLILKADENTHIFGMYCSPAPPTTQYHLSPLLHQHQCGRQAPPNRPRFAFILKKIAITAAVAAVPISTYDTASDGDRPAVALLRVHINNYAFRRTYLCNTSHTNSSGTSCARTTQGSTALR